MLTMRERSAWTGLVVVFVLTNATVTLAQDAQFASYADRLEQLESDYDNLSSQISQLAKPPSKHCTDPVVERPCGLVGGAALVYAKPWFSGDVAYENSVSDGLLVTTTTPTFDHGFQASPRFWLGYQNTRGGGIRARYWQFKSDDKVVSPIDLGALTEYTANSGIVGTNLVGSQTTADGDGIIAVQDMTLDVLDLEYNCQLGVPRGDCMVSGGVRYARYQQSCEVNFPPNFNVYQFSSFDLEGLGPTAAVEGLVPTNCWGLNVYGAVRASILLAEFDQQVRNTVGGSIGDEFLSKDRDHAIGVFEAEIGARWQHRLSSGATLFAQGSLEAQLWTETAHSLDDLTNLGFFGMGLGLGVSR
jgi:hypothetical protein